MQLKTARLAVTTITAAGAMKSSVTLTRPELSATQVTRFAISAQMLTVRSVMPKASVLQVCVVAQSRKQTAPMTASAPLHITHRIATTIARDAMLYAKYVRTYQTMQAVLAALMDMSPLVELMGGNTV
jgi:hypothetical protein